MVVSGKVVDGTSVGNAVDSSGAADEVLIVLLVDTVVDSSAVVNGMASNMIDITTNIEIKACILVVMRVSCMRWLGAVQRLRVSAW